jgi:light-regulated signal transduction histidine kinase (bacteriophytochrome)
MSWGGHRPRLAISQRIAEMHHGKIEVKSKLGEGSRFTVTLPLAQN